MILAETLSMIIERSRMFLAIGRLAVQHLYRRSEHTTRTCYPRVEIATSEIERPLNFIRVIQGPYLVSRAFQAKRKDLLEDVST